MDAWLKNEWVVGIGTGILSGLLVTWLLSLFLSKKKDREYQQRIASANRDVTFSIRSGIPEGNLPNRIVISALIRATARRYDVEPSELYQPKEISEELIKEVMDTNFLSSAKKVEYCSALIPLGEKEIIDAVYVDDESIESLDEHRAKAKERRKKVTQIEFTATLLAGLFSAIAIGLSVAGVVKPGIETGFVIFKESLLKSVEISVFVLTAIGILFMTAERFLQRFFVRRVTMAKQADHDSDGPLK